jgi:hypothetical protein
MEVKLICIGVFFHRVPDTLIRSLIDVELLDEVFLQLLFPLPDSRFLQLGFIAELKLYY